MITSVLAAFIGTIGFSVIFRVPKKYFLYCGICGASGWLVYQLLLNSLNSIATAVFFATVTVGILSRIFAITKKCPVTMFLISGIFPLVPGAGIYYTAYNAINSRISEAVFEGLKTFKISVVIALAIPLVLMLPKRLFNWPKKRSKSI